MKIIINHSSMIPIYEQIVEQVKALIRNGKLKENDNLPSVRSLAKELKISALTVKKAYDSLENEGFTVTIHGKGTYVTATNTELLLEEQKKELESDLERVIQKGRCICTFASARESTSFKNGYAFLYIAGVFHSIFFVASYSRILSFNI